MDWTIGFKVCKELSDSPWNGDMIKYNEWRTLMRDNLVGAYQRYGRRIHEIKACKHPLTLDFLNNHRNLPGMNIDMPWITTALWTFIVRNVKADARKNFKSLVDGEELNGAELWRMLYVTNEGGAEEVECADLGAFHTFHACPSMESLPQRLGLWNSMDTSHGNDLPQRHLNITVEDAAEGGQG